MAHLTRESIQKAEYKGNERRTSLCVLWDDTPKGLGLRVSPGGKKTWIISYRSKGKVVFHKIGDFPTLGLAEARRKATRELLKVYEGEDPAEKKRQRVAAISFRDVCFEYLNEYAISRKKSWKEDEHRIKRILLPVFGGKKAEEIKRSDILKLHREHGKESPYEANRILSLVSIIFKYAIDSDLLPEGMLNPAAGIRKHREKPRKRWLENDEELLRFLDAVNAEENIFYRTFFMVLLLSGMRKSELRMLKWSDVDLEAGTARLETTKSGDAQIRQLSPVACAMLTELPRFAENPYVFPSPIKPGEPLGDLRKPWDRILLRSDLENFRMHDLRRSFVSMLANAGTPMLVASRLAGHSSTKVTEAVYSIIGQEPLKEAAVLVSDKVMGIDEIRRKARDTA